MTHDPSIHPRARSAPPREPSSDLSRRTVLGVGIGAAALLGTGGRALASNVHLQRPHARSRPPVFGDLISLINRATHGFTIGVWNEAKTLGYHGWLESQLAYQGIEDGAVDAMLASYPSLAMTTKQIYDTYVNVNPMQTTTVELHLKAGMILRAVYSKRQLYERMVEFWTDHFNIDQTKNDDRWLKTADDRDVIRAHALDTFPNLLNASAHSAAMSFYLDNYINKKLAPNENYARELMELHTLGVGNYTENDVKEVARCLTGWTFKGKTDPNYGAFMFKANDHDTNSKTVLGHTIPAGGGESDGLTVLSILVNHPATAQFIARKMCVWLLSYTPPQAIVDQVAATFTATGGDIKAMIRVILDPMNLEIVDGASNLKIRRPFHLVASLLRQSAVTSIAQIQRIVIELQALGQSPYEWPAPNGYPDALTTWSQAVLPRWTFAEHLFDNKINGTSVDTATLLAGVPKNQLAQQINVILSGGTLHPEDVGAVQAYVDATPQYTDALRREAMALLASSPSYQYY